MGPISQFLETHFHHFNARELREAADAYAAHSAQGGGMLVTLAGAMSTGRLGISLAEMIRHEKVQAISCTGANLEEDVFNLVGGPDYIPLSDYDDLTPQDEEELRDASTPRVTDTALAEETAVKPVTDAVLALWQEAERLGQRHFPHEYLYQLLRDETLAKEYQRPLEESWLYAAMEADLPLVVPGWEDSTLGNALVAAKRRGDLRSLSIVKSGLEYLDTLATWYETESRTQSIGFFQIGGGIAGDFPICVVPMLRLEEQKKVPYWGYFCQITDADVSYGGYSGALPNEKITWEKLEAKTPTFAIKSDASIVAPLIFARVLGQ